MIRRDKCASADRLASLAVGELRPRKATKIRAHIARCETCTQLFQQLNAIPAILASLIYPPMPDYLSAQIGSAISREAFG
jgi:anti-sigma factor RsiW